MRQWAKYFVAGSLLALSGAANAQFSATVTAVSDYDFRGVTQTAGDPALQGSVDYAFTGAGSGFSIGAWASNVDFGPGADSDIELDLYGAYSMSFEDGFNWNMGLVYYTYHPGGDDVDYGEVSLGAGWKNFSAKIWYANDYGNTGDSAEYFEANYNQPLPQDWGLTFHLGYSTGDYWDNIEYTDWAVGVTKSFGNFNFALKYIDGSDLEIANNTPGDVFSSDGKVWLSVSTTFPWGT